MKKTIAIMLLFTSMAAHSDELKKTSIGPGNSTCGRYNNLPPARRETHLSWVLGYLVAENFRRPGDFLINTDFEAIWGALDLYCKENPLENVSHAASYVMSQLIRQSK